MKKVSLIMPKYLQNNVIFDEQSPLNRDNIFAKYIDLKKEFQKHGYGVGTNDIFTPSEADVVIYFDMPAKLPEKEHAQKSFLILIESDIIKPENYDTKKHSRFNKIFTWHDRLVDGKKYIKLNFSHKFPKNIETLPYEEKKLCTLIAGNKRVSHPLELYSERVKAIRWFEEHHPEEFDLYGVGWEKYRFNGPKPIRLLNKVPILGELYAKATNQMFPSYRGKVDNKKETLKKYKFSICYENGKEIPGYITEKIFDSFFAGCVPVYLGAPNIRDYVPSECFIDKREFSCYEELYNYLSTMPKERYLHYIESIKNYLLNEDSRQFTTEFYAKRVVSTIIGAK